MGRPYSLDLRERVVASVEGGRSCRETAGLFGVSVASVVKWSQRDRATGSAAAKPMGRRDRPLILLPEREWLLTRLAAKPDLTLRGVQAELAARGIRVSCKAIWNFFRAEQVTFKKKPARGRAGSTRRGPPAGAMEDVPGPR
jgi:transposase